MRDIDVMAESLREFGRSLTTPWTYIPGLIAAVVVAAMMLLPWLATDK